MLIRLMTYADLPAIIHLGGDMHRESQYSWLTYSPERVAEKCRQVLSSDDYFGIVADKDGSIVGMMGGQVYRYEYGDDLMASDILVYVSPEHRGSMAFIRMIRQYVAWAKDRGAKLIFLSQSTGINIEAVSNLYQRLGFRPVGAQHCLEVR